MSRWYRRYVGTVSDPKIAEVAMVANCSRALVIATWDAILESACEVNDAGKFSATSRNVAATLQEQHATVERVFATMTELGMISNGVISAWSKRQFQSDSSTERSKKHRQLKQKKPENGAPASRNGDATLQQRCATPPDTDTDTDNDVDDSASARLKTLDGLQAKLEAAGAPALASVASHPGLLNLSIPLMWIEQGCDLERDVLPAVAEVAKRRAGKGLITTWNYFTQAVANAKAARLAGLPAGTTPARTSAKSKPASSAFADALARHKERLNVESGVAHV